MGPIWCGRPVRSFPIYAGQQNYPGWLWTATPDSLIGYVSLLERDRLWLADFNPQMTALRAPSAGPSTTRFSAELNLVEVPVSRR